MYKLEWPDGRIEGYSVNVISGNLLNMAYAYVWDNGIIE